MYASCENARPRIALEDRHHDVTAVERQHRQQVQQREREADRARARRGSPAATDGTRPRSRRTIPTALETCSVPWPTSEAADARVTCRDVTWPTSRSDVPHRRRQRVAGPGDALRSGSRRGRRPSVELSPCSGPTTTRLPSRLTTIVNGWPCVALMRLRDRRRRDGVAGDDEDLVARLRPGGGGGVARRSRAATVRVAWIEPTMKSAVKSDDREDDVRQPARRRSRRCASTSLCRQ